MSLIRNFLFCIWLILLPFSWLIASYVEVIAPDKMIAPVLLLLGIISTFMSSHERLKRALIFIILATIFTLAQHASFINSFDVLWPLIREDSIKIGYFLIPLLCIETIREFRRASWFVVLIAMIGGGSAILVSAGYMTLPVNRFEVARFGIEELPKSVGLFTSYGDFAQYISYAVAWVAIGPGTAGKFFLYLSRLIVLIGAAVGVLGMQSRSVILSLGVSVCVLWLLKRARKRNYLTRPNSLMLLFSASVVAVALATFFASSIITGLAGFGGETAQGTASARMEQYAFAWDILEASPLIGADLETYKLTGNVIAGIHNTWLQLAAHGGLLAVLLFFALLYRSVHGVREAASDPEILKDSNVVTAYFSSFFISTMFYTGMGELFWALLGIAASLSCIKIKNGDTHKGQGKSNYQRGRLSVFTSITVE